MGDDALVQSLYQHRSLLFLALARALEKAEGSAAFFKPDPDDADYFLLYLLLPGGPQISYHLQNAYLALLPAGGSLFPVGRPRPFGRCVSLDRLHQALSLYIL